MNQPLQIRRRQPRSRQKGPGRRLALALTPAVPGAPPASFAWPGIPEAEEGSRRTLVTGSLAALLHLGAFGFLVLLASLTPVIQEELIPVRLLREAPPKPPEAPAPAPRVLAERRLPDFAPQLQSVKPQVLNPRVIAQAAPAVRADSLALEAVAAVRAPAQVERRSLAVERVSPVNSIATARASAVDVPQVVGPAVRGPIRIEAPAGPSVGPRQVATAAPGHSMGSATFEIGGAGSSVREGLASDRDVIGSPEGQPLVNVDTVVGEGFLRGSGGTGAGIAPASAGVDAECTRRPEVQAYLDQVEERTLARWRTPPGVADSSVTLRFQLDVAGSAQQVELVRAASNALGASAIDAMRAASPFPPMPDPARCLADKHITGTFRTSTDGAG
jgi:TonB family protein